MVTTSISGQIIHDPTKAKTTTGTLAADTKPGSYVILDASTLKWTKVTNATEAYRFRKGGVLTYTRRPLSTGLLPAIGDAVDIDGRGAVDQDEICLKGRVSVFIDDPVAAFPKGSVLQISDTIAGNLMIVSANENTGVTSSSAVRGVFVAELAYPVVSGDTVAVVDLL